MSPVAAALLLVVAFKIKHFVADYPLQTPYMLGKFKARGWVRPLAAHAGVHAGLTAAIALGAGPSCTNTRTPRPPAAPPATAAPVRSSRAANDASATTSCSGTASASISSCTASPTSPSSP